MQAMENNKVGKKAGTVGGRSNSVSYSGGKYIQSLRFDIGGNA